MLPFTTAVFLGFLAIGVPLPILPVEVHDRLGYGTLLVGGVIGLQSLATLLTRQYAGRLCDRRGPKTAALLGFGTASIAGLLYLASVIPDLTIPVRLGLLLAGRLLLGIGESLFITGTAAWSIARVGHANAGRAMAWQGMAMYGALAVGAPVGGLADAMGGFPAVSIVAALCPVLGVLAAAWLPGVPATRGRSPSFLRVLRIIWAPGIGLALASSGFGTIAAFLALRYQARGWAHPGLGLTGFGVAYIIMRLLFGGVPDRAGGGRVAMASLAVEAAGLALIAAANQPWVALLGAAVTGLGYSLVFPSLGLVAMRRIPADQRGVVLAAYLACFDLGLGAAGPTAGLVASGFGLPAAFLAAAAAALASLLLTAASSTGPQRASGTPD